MLNAKGVEKVKALQDVAMKESRLKIPLMFAMDVIHGYETAFPVPLAMASTWNLEQIEAMARTAAIEASSVGHLVLWWISQETRGGDVLLKVLVRIHFWEVR